MFAYLHIIILNIPENQFPNYNIFNLSEKVKNNLSNVYQNHMWRSQKIQILSLPLKILIHDSMCFNDHLKWLCCRLSCLVHLGNFFRSPVPSYEFLLMAPSASILPPIVFHWEIILYFSIFYKLLLLFCFLIHLVNMKHLHLVSRTHICQLFLSHFGQPLLVLTYLPNLLMLIFTRLSLRYFLFSFKITP